MLTFDFQKLRKESTQFWNYPVSRLAGCFCNPRRSLLIYSFAMQIVMKISSLLDITLVPISRGAIVGNCSSYRPAGCQMPLDVVTLVPMTFCSEDDFVQLGLSLLFRQCDFITVLHFVV